MTDAPDTPEEVGPASLFRGGGEEIAAAPGPWDVGEGRVAWDGVVHCQAAKSGEADAEHRRRHRG